MAKQVINVGTSANDGTGDTLRNSQQKANSNFTELYDRGLQEITDVNNETTNNVIVKVGSNQTAITEGSIAFTQDIGGSEKLGELGIPTLASTPIGWNLPNFSCNLNGCIVADNYTNDTTAAAGGIAIGQMYHTAGVVKIRLT